MSNFFQVTGRKTLLVAGCDTEVGKTVTTSILAAYWARHYGDRPLGLIKLMQTGIGDDEHYRALFASQTTWDLVTPLKFATPVAPPIAAEREGKAIDLAVVWQTLQQLQASHDRVLAEGLGSLGSPVTDELTVADIAGLWRLESVLVVPVKLGAMGQAIAQVALARQTKVPLKGLVLSCGSPEAVERLEDWASPSMLTQFTGLPVLGVIPYLTEAERVDLDVLASVAATFDLEQLGYFS